MTLHKKFLTTAAAVALAFAVGACSSSSDDDETAGMMPPATTDPAPDPTPDPTTDPVELAETAYGEYLEALTAYEVARGVYALTPTAANLAALREAVDKVVTEASDALVLAGDGTAAQLVRAQNAVGATVTNSSDVAAIEYAVMAAANLVTALTDAATAATAYDGAKAAYEATGGVTQANLEALSDAAAAAKATADAALALAQGGSAAQLSEAQAAVAAADMAATHASGITMALEGGIADALTAYDTAKTAHTAAKTAHDGDASVDNANALKTAADTLLAAAMTANEKGVLGATAEQQTALASVSVTDAEAYVATADTAVTTAQATADAAAVVAATAAAKTKTTAIEEEAEQTAADDAGIGGSVATGETTTYSMTIDRDRDGTTVTIADSGMAGDDDPKFTLYKDLGHGSTMHTREMEADEDGNVVEEVVIVSTDIQAPKAVAFAKFEDDEGVATQVLNAHTDTTNDDTTVTFEALTVVTANFALIESDAFTAGTEAELTFNANDAETPGDEAFETAGTYNGAMGTYRCNEGTECTVNIDEDGKVSGVGTGWVFTPGPRATSDQPDYDYLRYGFWLERTKDADGVVTLYDEVETYAVSSVDRSGNVSAVEGSATYEGGSTGVYVRNVYDSLGAIDTANSGHFTADVVLEATFGQVENDANVGTIAANLLNTLTGTIDNFELSGGEANLWAVNLDGDIIANDGTASGAATGGGTPGKFNATFHGDVMPVLNVVPKPSSVVGEFDANFSNGSVAGGFGARN